MNGLINFIKGIFGFIGGLFGGKQSGNGVKKGKGYFLELDEAATPAAAPAPSAPVASTPAAAPATPAPTVPKSSTRKEKLAALAAESAPAPAAPAPVAAVTPAPTPAPVLPAETAFATKYLVSTGNAPRRRPGANMSSYLDMARKMGGAMS